MASNPLRPCRHPGCPALTRVGWCAKHKPPTHRRASAEYHDWYILPIWRNELRPAQLLREPFCRACAARYPTGDPRRRTRATVVDHIRPFRGDWGLFVDANNHQSLCERCHNQKTAREQAENRAKTRGLGAEATPAPSGAGGRAS